MKLFKKKLTRDLHYGTGQEKEAIILVKGLHRTVEDMDIMGQYLNKVHGYYVIALDFPRSFESLEQSARTCTNKIHAYDLGNKFQKIHFVGASRGGLIIRKMLENGLENTIKNIDSCVMLGTPNQGSIIAQMYCDTFWAKPLFRMMRGKDALTLRPGKDGINTLLRNEFPSKKIQLGVIAGFDKNVYFFLKFGKYMFKYNGLHDGVVGVEETKLPGTKQHLIIPNIDHIEMESDQDSLDQAVHFIKTKKFTPFKDENRKKKPLKRGNPLLK